MAWSDRTNWHVAPGNGQNATANKPTINIEVGDALDFGVATNMSCLLYTSDAADE